jgi:hypothetical protein
MVTMTHKGVFMEKNAIPALHKQIGDVLRAENKDFIPLKQCIQKIPAGTWKHLGLKKNSSLSAFLKLFETSPENPLQIYKGPRTYYIGFPLTAEEMILGKLAGTPGLSPRNLCRYLPMLKKDFITALNRLAEAGRISCTFSGSWGIRLYAVPDAGKAPAAPRAKAETILFPQQQADDAALSAAFQQAYGDIGQGRGFVRIHRIRERLGWPPELFHRIMQKLLRDYVIEIHGGDPSALTEKEIRDSYRDENGTLYITLTWWGK